MTRLLHHLNRLLPSVDWLLTINLIVWGIACLLALGGAIICLP